MESYYYDSEYERENLNENVYVERNYYDSEYERDNFDENVEHSEGFYSCPVPSVILEAVRRQEHLAT